MCLKWSSFANADRMEMLAGWFYFILHAYIYNMVKLTMRSLTHGHFSRMCSCRDVYRAHTNIQTF